MGQSMASLFSFLGIGPKCAALVPQYAIYSGLWFDGIWRTVFQCSFGRADRGDFLRIYQEMVWGENCSSCLFFACHKSLAYHDVSMEPRIESLALFSAAGYRMLILLPYLQVCSQTHPFLSHFSCFGILCLWSIYYRYSPFFGALLWTCRLGNALAKQEKCLAKPGEDLAKQAWYRIKLADLFAGCITLFRIYCR